MEDSMLNPPEPEVYGTCEVCGETIYKGQIIYSSCDLEVCEDCATEFLQEYRRMAQ